MHNNNSNNRQIKSKKKKLKLRLKIKMHKINNSLKKKISKLLLRGRRLRILKKIRKKNLNSKIRIQRKLGKAQKNEVIC
jgi:hypothetical protein